MMYDKHFRLIEKLIRQTKMGKLEWRSAADGNGFQISFRTNAVLIRERNISGSLDYIIDLIDEMGSVVESFTDDELNDAEGISAGGKYFERMGLLLELARRSALGSDKVLDSILDDLGDDIPF